MRGFTTSSGSTQSMGITVLKPLADDLWVDIDDISVVYFGKTRNEKGQVECKLYLKDFPEKITYLISADSVKKLKAWLAERVAREEADAEHIRRHRDNGAGP